MASPAGSRLATAAGDGTAIVWDVDTGKQKATLHGHMATVSRVDFSPTSSRIVTGGPDGTVRLWDAETGVEVLRFDVDGADIRTVAWSHDGRTIAATDNDKHLYLWSAQFDVREQLVRRAHELARQEKWDEASDAFGEILKSQNHSGISLYRAICQLMAGNVEGYWATCREQIKSATKSDPKAVDSTLIAWICVLHADSLTDYSTVLKLAREGVRQHPEWQWDNRRFGAIHFRAGRYREAITELKKIPTQPSLFGETLFLLAMAHEAIGDHREALRYLQEGEAWTKAFEQREEHDSWHFYAELHILQREARGKIDPSRATRNNESGTEVEMQSSKHPKRIETIEIRS